MPSRQRSCLLPAMSASSSLATPFTRAAGIEVPLLCGAMYPCSNPELVAAASEAGALIGPLWGGVITEWFGWRWVFASNLRHLVQGVLVGSKVLRHDFYKSVEMHGADGTRKASPLVTQTDAQ